MPRGVPAGGDFDCRMAKSACAFFLPRARGRAAVRRPPLHGRAQTCSSWLTFRTCRCFQRFHSRLAQPAPKICRWLSRRLSRSQAVRVTDDIGTVAGRIAMNPFSPSVDRCREHHKQTHRAVMPKTRHGQQRDKERIDRLLECIDPLYPLGQTQRIAEVRLDRGLRVLARFHVHDSQELESAVRLTRSRPYLSKLRLACVRASVCPLADIMCGAVETAEFGQLEGGSWAGSWWGMGMRPDVSRSRARVEWRVWRDGGRLRGPASCGGEWLCRA